MCEWFFVCLFCQPILCLVCTDFKRYMTICQGDEADLGEDSDG